MPNAILSYNTLPVLELGDARLRTRTSASVRPALFASLALKPRGPGVRRGLRDSALPWSGRLNPEAWLSPTRRDEKCAQTGGGAETEQQQFLSGQGSVVARDNPKKDVPSRDDEEPKGHLATPETEVPQAVRRHIAKDFSGEGIIQENQEEEEKAFEQQPRQPIGRSLRLTLCHSGGLMEGLIAVGMISVLPRSKRSTIAMETFIGFRAKPAPPSSSNQCGLFPSVIATLKRRATYWS